MQYLINETGRQEIRDILLKNHLELTDYNLDEKMLDAWCRDAEFQLENGNSATIELKSWDNLSGKTQEFEISLRGVDEEWLTWLDGDQENAIVFQVPVYPAVNIVEEAAKVLGVEVCAEINVERI
jgi:hypothetical protein